MRYRVCKSFTVESGHMLSKHPEKCRWPHGHTRTVELVLSSDRLDANDMVIDFKLIKLIAKAHIERYDHRMAINSQDPLRAGIESVHPDSLIIFDNVDPTTERIAEEIFQFVSEKLAAGFSAEQGGVTYSVAAGSVQLDSVRVHETKTSWAEVSA